MLKFKILWEEFLTGGNMRGSYHEIFVNPTDKEVREMGDDLRFIIDNKTKKVFVSNADLLHDDMVDLLKGEGHLTDFDYSGYWQKGTDSDRFITMNKEGDNYYSDSMTDMLYRVRSKDNEKEVKDKVKTLINSNFNWIKGKWFNHNGFQKGLDEVREML